MHVHPSVQKYLQKFNRFLAFSLALFHVLLSTNCTEKSLPQFQPQQKWNHLNKINAVETNVIKVGYLLHGIEGDWGIWTIKKNNESYGSIYFTNVLLFWKNFTWFFFNLSFESVEMWVNARSSWQPLKFLHVGLQHKSGKREYSHKTMRILHSPHKFLFVAIPLLPRCQTCLHAAGTAPAWVEWAPTCTFLSLLFWFILNTY